MCPTDARHAALHKEASHCSTVTHWPAAATGDASASVEHSKLNVLLGHGHLEYSFYTLDVHGSAVLVAHSRFTAASIAIIT